MRETLEHIKLLYASFNLSVRRRFLSLTYSDILDLKSFKQSEECMWGEKKLCKNV